MAENRELSIPIQGGNSTVQEEIKEEVAVQEQPEEEIKQEPALTKDESEYIEKVFFEEDETVRLRDGVSYKIPPLGLKDAKNLMNKLNTIDTGIIIANLIEDGEGEDNYDQLLDVLLMAFKPYHKHITVDYLADYVDITSAKAIIDIMIGLNGLKKSL
ncbi:DNA polymerase III subunit gamma/tau [Metabacillus fastidiosus]|uniref:DNA polymerase III subunit gamma/tau n=1 Tax=Metabacillus fastidiosus TaxID=1458 RepID=UPI003D27DB5B